MSIANPQRLKFTDWQNIFRNTRDDNEEVEVTWLDEVETKGEWCLNCDCELFEDGFETEQEAQERLDFLERLYDSTISIVNEQTGIPFIVKIVKYGEGYGRNYCLTHDRQDPLIEFYDARYVGKFEDWEEGQFVSRYFASTILEHDGGLCLDGGIPNWTVSRDNMEDVKNFIKRFV